MKLLVVGLDGVCRSVLDPMIADGIVPSLAGVCDDGVVGPLESQLPPWTPSAWPSMYTGVNPGKHGVYDFLQFDGYDWDVVNRSHVKEFAVWELLSMRGFNSVVLNVPVTHPPREFDGVLVPGYVAPEAPASHPPGVWDELDRTLAGYSLYADTLSSGPSDDDLAQDLVRLSRMRGEAFRHLVAEHEPEFGFVQFQATDTVFHEFPDDETVARRVYGAVDREVGEILDVCDADVTLVVSDHGIGPMAGQEFRVNDYLRENEFLVTTAEGDGMPSWKTKTRQEDETRRSAVVSSVADTAIGVAAGVGLTSQRIGAALRHLGLEQWVLERVPTDLVLTGTEQVDFAASTAYMRARTEMGIRINLEGREPSGVVPPSEYERVRTELIEALAGVTTPTGDPVFEGVHRREAIFDGPYLEDAPDVVTVPNRFDQFLVATLKGDLFGEPTEPWEHKREGILMATGDGIDRSADLSGAHLFDVAPTILSAFGLPVSDRMDGSTLPIVDPTDRESYPPFEPVDPVATDDADVEERLSDLGYLE